MPGTYAHYTFGKEVLKYANDEVGKIITDNLDLFFIGLHGPDILFYYKPLTIKNSINSLGCKIHHEKANIFFERAKKIISNSEDKDGYIAYIIGFICHFMLDSECHPYINKITKKENLSHTEIESEFDKLLLIRDGKDPFHIDLTNHLRIDSRLSKYISPFFDIENKDVFKSIKCMKFYCSILNSPNKLTRFMIFSSLKVFFIYDKIQGIFFHFKDNPKCKDICVNIETLYNNSINKTATVINDFYNSLKKDTPLSERFNRDFL